MSFILVTYLLKINLSKGGEEILQSQFLVFQISRKERKVFLKRKIRSTLTFHKTSVNFFFFLIESRVFASLSLKIIKDQKLYQFLKLFVFKVTEI